MTRLISVLLHELGALRVLLAILVVLVVICAPFSGGPTGHSGWRLLTTVVAPSLFVMTAFVLPLDMLMSRLFMADADEPRRGRLQRVIRIELGLLVVLLAAWSPFVVRLFNQR